MREFWRWMSPEQRAILAFVWMPPLAVGLTLSILGLVWIVRHA